MTSETGTLHTPLRLGDVVMWTHQEQDASRLHWMAREFATARIVADDGVTYTLETLTALYPTCEPRHQMARVFADMALRCGALAVVRREEPRP